MTEVDERPYHISSHFSQDHFKWKRVNCDLRQMSLLYLQIHEEWMETCSGSAYLEQVIIKYKEAKTLNEGEDKIKNWS